MSKDRLSRPSSSNTEKKENERECCILLKKGEKIEPGVSSSAAPAPRAPAPDDEE
jgi:hypothetical protein